MIAICQAQLRLLPTSVISSDQQVISGLFAGVAGLSLVKQAAAEIEVRDDRDVRSRGFDIIYEARDVDLPQAQRDGFTQVRVI